MDGFLSSLYLSEQETLPVRPSSVGKIFACIHSTLYLAHESLAGVSQRVWQPTASAQLPTQGDRRTVGTPERGRGESGLRIAVRETKSEERTHPSSFDPLGYTCPLNGKLGGFQYISNRLPPSSVAKVQLSVLVDCPTDFDSCLLPEFTNRNRSRSGTCLRLAIVCCQYSVYGNRRATAIP